MAMTSQTLIPTSTLASASSTPTTSNSDDPPNTIASLFSSAGSPPLVVALVTVGLFFIAVVCVSGWRRRMRSRSRRLGNQLIIPNRRHKSIPLLGKRPILWDVWADPKVTERSDIKARRWENMTPMSAILTYLIPPVPVRLPVDPLPIGSVDPNGHVLFQMLRSLSAVERFYLPHPRLPPPPPLPPPLPPPPPQLDKEVVVSPGSHTSEEIEWGDTSSLHFSVIITMPTPRRCCSGTSGEDTDPDRMELGEFCIGTMDVPWSEGG